MQTIQDIEKTIANLPPTELAQFREWFVAFDADCWDRQLEQDVLEGKLARLAAAALEDFDKGQCKEL